MSRKEWKLNECQYYEANFCYLNGTPERCGCNAGDIVSCIYKADDRVHVEAEDRIAHHVARRNQSIKSLKKYAEAFPELYQDQLEFEERLKK